MKFVELYARFVTRFRLGDQPAGGDTAFWDRPANGGDDAEVFGATAVSAQPEHCAQETGSGKPR